VTNRIEAARLARLDRDAGVAAAKAEAAARREAKQRR